MIIPSIDLIDGRAVQLRQGKDHLLTSDRDPVELAREFGRYGPVAIVDLDAAFGRGHNAEVVRACCAVAECRVGGGIRTEDDVRNWIRRGADRVVVGTRAEPEFLKLFPAEWIVVAIDARGENVVVKGWTETTEHTVVDRARELAPYCGEFLFTQVEKEGMLGGGDLETARALVEAVDRPITVAGGIHTVDEVSAFQRLGCHTQLGRAVYEGSLDLTEAWIAQVRFDDRGLVPTVVQDEATGSVLMVAYSNAESLARALTRGEGWYWSRSRQELWHKGATSGNKQALVRAAWDCDTDTVLFRVRTEGPACHLGSDTCFGPVRRDTLGDLARLLAGRRDDPAATGYTRRLIDDGAMLAGKLREETEEVIDATEHDHLAWECADLLYHLMVRMTAGGVGWGRVEAELRSRFRSG